MILFYLIEIKRRVDGQVGEAIVYATLSIITLILLRFQTILLKANLINIPYSQEVLALILVLFIFATVFTLYKPIKEITDKKTGKRKRSSRKIKSVVSARNFSNQKSTKQKSFNDGYIDFTK